MSKTLPFVKLITSDPEA